MATTTLTNDWLGSRLKTLSIMILRKVDGENEWDEVYFWNQSCSKRGAVTVTLHMVHIVAKLNLGAPSAGFIKRCKVQLERTRLDSVRSRS